MTGVAEGRQDSEDSGKGEDCGVTHLNSDAVCFECASKSP